MSFLHSQHSEACTLALTTLMCSEEYLSFSIIMVDDGSVRQEDLTGIDGADTAADTGKLMELSMRVGPFFTVGGISRTQSINSW